jgi:hypothetical protein
MQRLGLIIAVVLCLRITAPAQTAGTGALAGTVLDASGAGIPNAKIAVKNETTGESREVVSQASGSYSVPLLRPGAYRVELTKPGFRTTVIVGVQINVTETARMDPSLEVGAIQEQVTVSTEALLLQTESSALGRVTDRAAVNDLPLVTRNYTQIVTLSPGIAANVTNASDLGRGAGGLSQGNFRSHGAGGADNNFQMNGLQIDDLQSSGTTSGGIAIPNPDAIQEFKVQTGLYDATYGRNAGANVNVVTRSGGNGFHGGIFEYFRNNDLNANDFFRNRAEQPKGILKQNQFGMALGGPLVKDKLLFFVSYQGTRQTNGIGSGGASSFFTPAFTDDRSRAALGKLFAGQPAGVGTATVAPDGSNISPQALALLTLKLPNGSYAIPTPQLVDPTQPFALRGFSAFSVPATFREDQFLTNLDYVQNAKSRIAGRFFFSNGTQNLSLPTSQLSTTAPGFPQLMDSRMRNLSVSHTYTVSASLLNQADIGFHRIGVPTIQQELFKWSDVGVKASGTANDYPAVGVNGSAALGGNGQGLDLVQNHYTFQDILTYLRGRQTIKVGGGFTHSQLDLSHFHFFGGLLFLTWPDFLLGLPGGPVASGGNGSSIGNVYLSIDIPGMLDRAWRLSDGNAFVQDDIRVTQSFTLNLGMRYERLENLADQGGRNSGFNLSAANPDAPATGSISGYVVSKAFPGGTVPAGVQQLNNNYGIGGVHQNNFGPRAGFAWRLPRVVGKQIALRGGYGIYVTRATGQPFLQLAAAPPFALLRQLQGVPNANASFASPFGPDLTFPQFPSYSPSTQLSSSFVDQSYRPPVTEQAGLNLQTELGRDFLLEVGFSGDRGTHQILNRSLNQALIASASNPIRGLTTNTVANIPQRVPILGFTAPGLNDIDSSASSWYTGLDVSVTKRMSKGLQFLAAYTFAHAYSTSARSTTAGGTSGITGDQYNKLANYGLSDFNREHRLVVSFVYELPRPQLGNAILNGLFGGWKASGVMTVQSGLPLTLTGTSGANIAGITSDRAQIAPGCTYKDLSATGSVDSKLNNYFTRSCIYRNAAGTAIWPVIGSDGVATAFGNSGVGIVSGPDQRNFDLSAIKRTRIPHLGEAGNLEFRAEFFNAFNTPQFSSPATNVSAANFGVISSTAVSPRIVQMALKLNF